jgi:hypothetical protein
VAESGNPGDLLLDSGSLFYRMYNSSADSGNGKNGSTDDLATLAAAEGNEYITDVA